MMGASNMRIEWAVQVREAMLSLVQSVTTLFITLIGYSAMAEPSEVAGLAPSR